MTQNSNTKLHTAFMEGASFTIATQVKTFVLDVDRLLYGTTKGYKDMVQREQDDYNRQGESNATSALFVAWPSALENISCYLFLFLFLLSTLCTYF